MIELVGVHPRTNEQKTFVLDETNNVMYDNMKRVEIPNHLHDFPHVKDTLYSYAISGNPTIFSSEVPLVKSPSPQWIMLKLGNKCNYSCSYCSQIPADSTEDSFSEIDTFTAKLHNIFDPDRESLIKFYGGEPFVYYAKMKKIVEYVHIHFPKVKFEVTTNGSLLNRDKVDFLKKYFYKVVLSHDGPGQKHRNEIDFFDNPQHVEFVRELIIHFKEQFKFSSVLAKSCNFSRIDVNKYMYEKFGDLTYNQSGQLPNYYDDYSAPWVPMTIKECHQYAKLCYDELKTNTVWNFSTVRQAVARFIAASISGNPAAYVTKPTCGMHANHVLTVDTSGNVLSCGNVSSTDIAGNGEPHKLGHLDDVNDIKMTCGTHPLRHTKCQTCPVLVMCAGGCFHLTGKNKDLNCEVKYFSYIGMFACAFEMITGYALKYINHPSLPEHRRDFFGVNGPYPEEPKKKTFLIKQI